MHGRYIKTVDDQQAKNCIVNVSCQSVTTNRDYYCNVTH